MDVAIFLSPSSDRVVPNLAARVKLIHIEVFAKDV